MSMKVLEHAVWAHLGWDAFFWLSAVPPHTPPHTPIIHTPIIQ